MQNLFPLQLRSALPVAQHRKKLEAVRSGIDRNRVGRTDSSAPVRPSWHSSKKGNLKKKHNDKRLHEEWRQELVEVRPILHQA
jgi:hypothetical protein